MDINFMFRPPDKVVVMTTRNDWSGRLWHDERVCCATPTLAFLLKGIIQKKKKHPNFDFILELQSF